MKNAFGDRCVKAEVPAEQLPDEEGTNENPDAIYVEIKARGVVFRNEAFEPFVEDGAAHGCVSGISMHDASPPHDLEDMGPWPRAAARRDRPVACQRCRSFTP